MSEKKLVPVRLGSLRDLARIAASIAALGQVTYIVRVRLGDGRKIYGLIAVLRDYYNLYGLPMLYYVEDREDGEGSFILVKVDEQGEHIEVSKSTRPGWIAIPVIDFAEKPSFFPDEL